mmetsp:Transcript_25193/g.44795  ORF Transcript_25193/g.44795 Transcript_25193/m.44795 type:complete len:204 (-) Transcript_25193:350-961(-)
MVDVEFCQLISLFQVGLDFFDLLVSDFLVAVTLSDHWHFALLFRLVGNVECDASFFLFFAFFFATWGRMLDLFRNAFLVDDVENEPPAAFGRSWLAGAGCLLPRGLGISNVLSSLDPAEQKLEPNRVRGLQFVYFLEFLQCYFVLFPSLLRPNLPLFFCLLARLLRRAHLRLHTLVRLPSTPATSTGRELRVLVIACSCRSRR